MSDAPSSADTPDDSPGGPTNEPPIGSVDTPGDDPNAVSSPSTDGDTTESSPSNTETGDSTASSADDLPPEAAGDVAARPSDDPRMIDEYVRTLPSEGDRGRVVLVGAVHDHPASQYRAAAVVEDADPDAIALELPPLAVPLFEQYAADVRSPPAFGGEMSAAIQACETDRIVGVDGPSAGFARRLLGTLYREGATASTVRSSLRAFASVSRRAAVCRLAAGVAARTSLGVTVDAGTSYETSRFDDPADQADDERAHVRRARFALRAFGASDSGELRDAVRESHMADRIHDLRARGDVVAVLGIDHLDPVADAVTDLDSGD